MADWNPLLGSDWDPLLRQEFNSSYCAELQAFVAGERSRYKVYPPRDEVFNALHLTPCAQTKVVILGQDPYHADGQAHGLAFSVRRGVRRPPSLVNIHRELHDDLRVPTPDHGNLEPWARRGVLLLNATLTVRAGEAGSHRDKGWETFTDEVIRVIVAKTDPVVFILWGGEARRKKALIEASRHTFRVAAPFAAIRLQKLLRELTVQPGELRPHRRRAGGDRLELDGVKQAGGFGGLEKSWILVVGQLKAGLIWASQLTRPLTSRPRQVLCTAWYPPRVGSGKAA